MEVYSVVNVHVLNRDFTLEAIIDNYESLIWRPAYSDIGDCELFVGATPELVEILQRDRYLVRDTDITVEDGVVTYHNVMIIKNIQLSTSVEDGDYLTITGRELAFILHSRIVWGMATLTGTAENSIRSLINSNAINPSNTKRKIPTLTLDPAVGFSDPIDMQVTGDYLDETVITLCQTYDYGWEIYISNNAFRFRLYRGLDKSYAQTERPYVVFSDGFDNIYNTEYQLESENYANTTLVGGEGEGKDRTYTTVNDNNEGLERYELFTDARDISSSTDSGTLTPTQYKNLLAQRGKEKLAEVTVVQGFSGQVLSGVAYKYGTDFYLGDVVTVINEYGISRNVRVMSAIESYSEDGESLIPEFNM